VLGGLGRRSALRPMDTPLVSILTPSFEQGEFIADCIASVRNQTYVAVEHVICDGGSKDDTLAVLRGSPANVRWTSEPDRGQAHALNKAFSLSSGDVIGWLNSDDAYFDREAIARAVDILRSRPEIDVVYGHAALVGADNDLLHFLWAPRFNAWLFRYANFIVQPTVFVRRDALGESLVDERLEFTVDRELWLRLWQEGRRFARLDRVVAIDRHHGARKSVAMEDVGRQEDDDLSAKYGVPGGLRRTVVPKAFRIAARLWGARLLGRSRRAPAIDIHFVGTLTLLRRQVLTRRRYFPLLRSGGSE
jgi:glycosyltransferase involved in cell wall biosynthesis